MYKMEDINACLYAGIFFIIIIFIIIKTLLGTYCNMLEMTLKAYRYNT